MKKSIYDINETFVSFTKSENEKEHRESIEQMLRSVGLKTAYSKILKECPESILNLFINFSKAAHEKWVLDNERESMIKVGNPSKKYVQSQDFSKLSNLAFNLVLQNVVETLGLPNKSDFGKYTLDDLYDKGLLPGEIFMQFFLIETLAQNSTYNWKRSKVIIDQSIACLGICFMDIIDYLNSEYTLTN